MPALIQSLLDPRCYPHPVTAVQLIETHISWLLLTGSHAYKIKKPVQLEFVDFSTLERRRHFCDEELRLNGRLAPELYLEVVPITGSVERPAIGGHGVAIEYAVKMREFSQEDLLDRCLEAGRLHPAHIDTLADICARFHAAAAIAPVQSDFGTPASLLQPALANFHTIESLLSGNGVHLRIARLKRWTESLHAALAPVFAARKRAGRIRECHGDMHLGNMALIDGCPTIFDCIEFNDAFRWIDVMSEMAFAVMDLAARGRCELARRLLNRYLEASGDYDGLKVLRFYLVYRALVRAKVDCIRAREPDTAPAIGARQWQDFLDRIALAESFSRPCRPFLAITCGVSGSGKTHASQLAVERTDAIRIRSDIERKRLAGMAAAERSASAIDSGLYAEQMSAQTFARLAEMAKGIIAAGFPVIVDATFIRRDRRRPFQQLAASLGVPFLIIRCSAPDAVLDARIGRRLAAGADASEADLEVLRQQQQQQQPLEDAERHAEVGVDSTDPSSIAAMVDRLAAMAQRD